MRTGGPAVTEDVLVELVVSTCVLGTRKILLLNHTGRGFTTFTEWRTEREAERFYRRSFAGSNALLLLEENTQEQIKKVRSHPWIAKDVPVRGFIFDVDSDLLREVQPIAQQTAAWKNLGLQDLSSRSSGSRELYRANEAAIKIPDNSARCPGEGKRNSTKLNIPFRTHPFLGWPP